MQARRSRFHDATSATRPDDLAAYLTADRVGHNSALHVLRGVNPVQLEVTIGERVAGKP